MYREPADKERSLLSFPGVRPILSLYGSLS